MAGIFLSYRREDAGGHAGRLYDQLQVHFGPEKVFRDIDTLSPGTDFVEAIETAISSADVVVALIGRDWVSVTGPNGVRRLDEPEDYVRLELEAALRRGIPVIPVLVRSGTMPQRTDLPTELAPLTRRHAFDLPDQHWPFAVKALLAALEQHVSGTEDAPRTYGRTGQTPVAPTLRGTVERLRSTLGRDSIRPRWRIVLWTRGDTVLFAFLIVVIAVAVVYWYWSSN